MIKNKRYFADRKTVDDTSRKGDEASEFNFVDKIRLAKAAQEIDSSKGFEPKAFVSSASQKRVLEVP
jgi:hypothetical protein